MWIKSEINSLRIEADKLDADALAFLQFGKAHPERSAEMKVKADDCVLLAASKRRDVERLERGERWGRYVAAQQLDEYMAKPPVQPKQVGYGFGPDVLIVMAAFAFGALIIVAMVAKGVAG
jgi:hypothetical protein